MLSNSSGLPDPNTTPAAAATAATTTDIPSASSSSTSNHQRHSSTSSLAPQTQPLRSRSSSIVSVQEIRESDEDALDSESFANLNAAWVNYKGAWLIHVVLIVVAKVFLDTIPIEQDISWTILLQGYCLITFVMFHWTTGVPFESESSGGVWDKLTLWEQIDHGAQYTPAKKWLTILPILVFLISTHYTRFDHPPMLFTFNFVSLLGLGLLPKLPLFHRRRLIFGEEQQQQQQQQQQQLQQQQQQQQQNINNNDNNSVPMSSQ